MEPPFSKRAKILFDDENWTKAFNEYRIQNDGSIIGFSFLKKNLDDSTQVKLKNLEKTRLGGATENLRKKKYKKIVFWVIILILIIFFL